MDKWPEVFSELINHVRERVVGNPFGKATDGIIDVDIKIENPDPIFTPDATIPKPEVKL